MTVPAERSIVAHDLDGNRLRLGPAVLTDADVTRAAVLPTPDGSNFLVLVDLDPTGRRKLRTATESMVDGTDPANRLAFVVDGVVVNAPAVHVPIDSGELQLSGGLTEEQARALAEELSAGG
jgi:preprotein translocase subunit SecD